MDTVSSNACVSSSTDPRVEKKQSIASFNLYLYCVYNLLKSCRLFLVYAKQWWKEYLQIRATHRERLVKIFAQVRNSLLWYVLVLFIIQCT